MFICAYDGHMTESGQGMVRKPLAHRRVSFKYEREGKANGYGGRTWTGSGLEVVREAQYCPTHAHLASKPTLTAEVKQVTVRGA